MNHKRSFSLSAQGRIASAVSMALVLPLMSTAHAENIKPIGSTTVDAVNNVEVVNIANPNSNGLSHNQYNQFNVGESGAVLNNSLESGQSQLAGQLEANTNLSESASLILNEVVSNNPSLLLGQQEVFGMAADYVLANPNGITGKDIGFINTNRATLVVGEPTVAEENLTGFDIGNYNNKKLELSGDIQANDRLDLLAPTVDINGNIKAADAINVISGRSNIDYDSLETSEPEGLQSLVTLDGKILGSMQSGRIRIHNTDSGATQSLQGNFAAGDAFEASADNLNLIASQVSGESITLNGNDTLKIAGELQTLRTDDTEEIDTLADEVTQTTSGYQQDESYVGSTVSGNDIKLAGSNVEVEGSDIQGATIQATADNFDIVGAVSTDTTSVTERKSKGLWFNEDETLNKSQQYHQSSLNATGDLSLDSTADINVVAADIEGSNVNVNAGGDLVAKGENIENSVSEINRYKFETDDLKSGAHTITDAKQTANLTRIKGENVQLASGGAQRLEGVQIAANNTNIDSVDELTISGIVSTNSKIDEEDFKYWGGISGGETHIDNQLQNALTGSQIESNNISVTSKSNATISGSNLKSQDALNISADGDVTVTHDFATDRDYFEDRHGTAFNITDKKFVSDRVAQETVATDLSAKNVNVSGENINISGSQLSATGELNTNARNTLNSSAANATDITKTEAYDISADGEASSNLDLETEFNEALEQGVEGLLNGSINNLINNGIDQIKNIEVDATGSLSGVTTLTTAGTGESVNSSLSAYDVNLSAQNANVYGTDIDAVNNVTIEGSQVNTGASEALTRVDSEVVKSTGPEAYIRGGATGVEVGISIDHNQVIDEHSEYQAANTNISAGNDALVNATETLSNEGTKFKATNVVLDAQDIHNAASHDRIVDREVIAGGNAALDLYAAGSDLLNGGVKLSGDGSGVTTEQKTSYVTDIDALNNASIKAGNSATDAGTTVSAKQISISADNYNGTSAYDSVVKTAHSGSGDVNVNAGTSNFVDVTVDGGGNGSYQYVQTGDAKAVKGLLKADNINIEAGTKAVAAQNVDAKEGYSINAGEEARIAQDSDKQWTTAGGGDLGGSVGMTIIPAAAATGVVVGTPSFTGNGGFNYLSEEDAQAQTASVNAKDVTVTSDLFAQIDGATLEADDIFIKGNRANIAAGQDTHRAVGVATGGNGGFSLDIVDSIASSDDIGVGADLSVINETSNDATGANIIAKNVTVKANEADDALIVEAANITADNITLSNANQEGNVAVTAAESKDSVGNFAIGGNLAGAADPESFSSDGMGANLNVVTDNSRYYTLGSIKANQIDINSGSNIGLQGNINTTKLTTNAGNDLIISSAQDNVAKVDVDTQFAVDGSPIQFAAGATQDDIMSILEEDFNNGTILGMSVAGNAGFNIDNQQITHQTTVDADQFNGSIGSGEIGVNAAKVSATDSNLNGAVVKASDNDDFVRNVGGTIKGKNFSIPEFAETIPDLLVDALQGNPLEFDIPVEVDTTYEVDDEDRDNTKADINID